MPAVDESSLYLLNELPPGSSSCTPSHHGSSVHVCSAIPRPRDSFVCHYNFYCFFLLPKKKAQRYSWGQKSTQRQCWSFQADNAVCKLSGQKCTQQSISTGQTGCLSLRQSRHWQIRTKSEQLILLNESVVAHGRTEGMGVFITTNAAH